MEPVVNRLEEAYGEQVKFLALDANGDGEKAFKAGQLPGHPSFVILRPDGSEVWRGFGLVEQTELEAAIQLALETSRSGADAALALSYRGTGGSLIAGRVRRAGG
jgi:hypothetical protein